jgi:hypothetical protein
MITYKHIHVACYVIFAIAVVVAAALEGKL